VTVRISGEYGAETFSFASGIALTDVAAAINGATSVTGVAATVEGSGSTAALVLSSSNYGKSKFVDVDTISGSFATVDADGASFTRDTGRDVAATINGLTATGDGLTASVRSASLNVDLLLSEELGTLDGLSASSFSITGGGAIFSISPNIGGAGQVGLGIQPVHTSQLGDSTLGFLSSLGSGEANDLNSENFTEAQRIVRQASRQVSQTRGRLGAFQTYTLEPTIRSLQVAFENTAAAESAIRDTDFAEETSRLTRTQILVNAASIALQLANAAPQNVLSLLQ
jgi:flagellin